MSLDKRLKIAVLMGGPGAEREVSLASGSAVAKALKGEGYEVVEVDVRDKTPEIPDGTGLCFNLIHGTFGEDGELQAYLEGKGIPYTGAGVQASRVAFDKGLSKERFLAEEVPTPLSEMVDCAGGVALPQMPAPFVVKPPREGSSVGIRVVKTPQEAQEAMEHAASFCDDLLVEQFVEGRELTVGVMEGEVFPVVEIIPPEGEWYDMATKYPWLSGKSGGSQYVCPANLTPAEEQAVKEAALKAYQALEIEIYARVDVLLEGSGEAYVLEANTIPGMTETSLLPMGAKEAGYDFPALCVEIASRSLAARVPE